jgi:hypothetical protein
MALQVHLGELGGLAALPFGLRQFDQRPHRDLVVWRPGVVPHEPNQACLGSHAILIEINAAPKKARGLDEGSAGAVPQDFTEPRQRFSLVTALSRLERQLEPRRVRHRVARKRAHESLEALFAAGGIPSPQGLLGFLVEG